MTDSKPIIIIGGGHNGLVCAAYLAKAGRKVLVLEAADQVGGAAITREFAPGFRVSAGAHLLNLFDPGVWRDLGLTFHGLKLTHSKLKTIALAVDGDHLIQDGDHLLGADISARDQANLAEYRRRMQRFARLLNGLYQRPPPRLAAGGFQDYLSLARVGLNLKRLGKRDMREFMRIIGINIYDVLEENFEHPLLKGALALDAVLGNHLGPRSNNSVLNALHRQSGKIAGQQGAFALAQGGMGAVCDAICAAAKIHGAAIRTSSPVERILFAGDRICGVALESGEEIQADVVVSSADSHSTFMQLVGARNLEAGFAARINRIRSKGNTAKLHLALDGLPDFAGLNAGQLGERLILAPDPDYVERAFDHAKYGRYSTQPALEITLPSVHDNSLAPAGKQVLSAIVQYAPHGLKQGWENAREPFENLLLELLEEYAPGIRGKVIATELLTPQDIEKEFRITGGHWHHGELTLDQAFMLRPAPGAAQYATPVNGLYLCGAACHPGGGVMGSAGRNAATVVLKGESA